MVALVESGAHMLFGANIAGCNVGELTLAKQVMPELDRGILCLADRNFLSFELWEQAQGTGAVLLWRANKVK